MTLLRGALADAVIYAAQFVTLPPELAEQVQALKSLEYYRRNAERLARSLYRGEVTQDDFEYSLLDLMDAQLDRAWAEGMRANGLDPKADMTPEMDADLERFKNDELEHIPEFSAAIVQAAQDDATNDTPGLSMPAMVARADLWAQRYPDIVNTAILLTAEPDNRLEWVYGDTEHCGTCAALNGIVASAQEWDASGYQPQSPPNERLECGGWRCACTLQPTEKRRTRNRFEIWDSLRV